MKKMPKSQDLNQLTHPVTAESKNIAPLDGKCRTAKIVYQATVTKEDTFPPKNETYIGLSSSHSKQERINI